MSNTSRLALGTAQFGFPYGFNRGDAAIDPVEAGRILAMAWERGIDMLDTATEYGEAESAIGNAKPAHADFRIVTKTPRIGGVDTAKPDLQKISICAEQSLRRLKVKNLDALLVHHARDLLSQSGDEIFDILLRLKQRGLARLIGVSVYDPDTLNQILERYPIDVVQLPFNVFDQRFEHSILHALTKRKIEVHVRSIFLQGVLLTAPDLLPAHLQNARARLAALRSDSAAAGISVAAAALHYVAMQQAVSRIVFGVQSASELRSNLETFTTLLPNINLDFQKYRIADDAIIDPRRWPSVV
jgi:aryl-alcohol dehydrogenase-like predicted oxidoreductase